MDIDLFPKNIRKGELVLSGGIAVLIFVMLLGISLGTSGALNEELKYNITAGKINSTLKNINENTTWLLSGSWKSNLFTNTKFNHSNPAKFSAKIDMVMANGSFPHKHKISHFMLMNISAEDFSKVYEGYAAVSMELGPVFAIPIKIKNFQNGTITISLELLDDVTVDQAKVISHFEGKPILGMMRNIIS